jgi:hypothetical protein
MDQPSVEKIPSRRESPVEEQSLESLEPEVAHEKAVLEKVIPEKAVDEKMKSHLAIQEAAYTVDVSPIDNQKVYATAAEIAHANIGDTPHHTNTTYYTADELKKFIVWSELLGKPIALREEWVTPPAFPGRA